MSDAGEGKLMRVRVLFFGAARETVGRDEETLTVRSPATTASVFKEVMSRYPGLGRFGRSLLVAVNEEYAQMSGEVHDGDEIAIFPPVSGGGEQPKDFFELTTSPIDVGDVARRVLLPSCGATVTLDGYTRSITRGRKTRYLIYEAYEPMALSEMRRLGREAHARFEIAHIGIVHRTGRVEVGETSVVISVSAPHRRAAFEACEWAIRELKRTVPIWKKEILEDGELWVESDEALSPETYREN